MPSDDELRDAICEILKKVDFDTVRSDIIASYWCDKANNKQLEMPRTQHAGYKRSDWWYSAVLKDCLTVQNKRLVIAGVIFTS